MFWCVCAVVFSVFSMYSPTRLVCDVRMYVRTSKDAQNLFFLSEIRTYYQYIVYISQVLRKVYVCINRRMY